jgi:hypothetical protein
MMKGFSLIEFLAGSTIFLSILLFTYPNIDGQKSLLNLLLTRSRPEEESNYRLLIVKNLLQDSGAGFLADPFLKHVPHFFPDLTFGVEARPDAFSIVRPIAPVVAFQMSGKTTVNCSRSYPLSAGDELALAGVTDEGQFDWNYARVKQALSDRSYIVDFALDRGTLVAGSLVMVDISRFLFQNRTLYCVTTGGQVQPFFGPIDEFRYEYSGRQLKLFWKIRSINANITATL